MKRKKVERSGSVEIEGVQYVSAFMAAICEYEIQKYQVKCIFDNKVMEKFISIPEIIKYHEAKIKQAKKWELFIKKNPNYSCFCCMPYKK
jgi:hypothetical protein